MKASEHNPHIYSEQVGLLFNQLRLGAVTSLVNGGILCLMLWPVQPAQLIVMWYLGMILVNLPRVWLAGVYRRTPRDKVDARLWAQRLIASNIASGTIWGVGAYLLFPADSLAHQAFMAFILAGITAGSAPLYSALRSAYAAFILPVLVPFSLRLLLPGVELQVYLGLLVLFYAFVLLVSSKRIHTTIVESLQLRYSNAQLLGTLSSARQQLEVSNRALHEQLTKLEQAEQASQKSNAMLNAVSRAQMRFIQNPNLNELFDELLANLLRLTDSEYGFIGQVLREADGSPYLKPYALTNIAWNEKTRPFYDGNALQGQRLHQGDTLFDRVVATGRTVIGNDPDKDVHGVETKGPPAVYSYMGVPFFHSGELIGVVGIANRPGGYSDEMVEELAPFLHTCSNIIHGERLSAGRVVAENNLQRKSEELRAIHAQIADGIATLDFEGRIMTVNPAVERMFRMSEKELSSMPLRDLIKVPDRAAWQDLLEGFRDVDTPNLQIELQAVRADTERGFPIEIMLSHLRLSDDDRIIAVLRDVTERKRVERLKNEFIATVSHELRTPLTSIRGSLGLLQGGISGALSEQSQHLLDIALSNSDRLSLLINDLLDMEKVESGGMRFQLQSVSLRELLTEAVQANAGYAQRYNVRLQCEAIEPNLRILADAERTMQVLNNLISNAVKFSPVDSDVRISARRVSAGVRIEVADSGCGIPEKFQDKVFEKFTQADASDSRSIGGTGLGLSISKAIVERMHGTIGFRSTEETGTTFYFELPCP